MLRKIILGGLMAGLIGLLVFGAINRTVARTENTTRNAREPQQETAAAALLPFGVPDMTEEQGDSSTELRQGSGRQQGGNAQSGGGANRQPDGSWQPSGGSGGSGNQQGNGRRWGGGGRQGQGSGIGQAQPTEWIILEGSVKSADQTNLIIQTSQGESIAVSNQPWRYALSQGFSANPGDQVTVKGFYDTNGIFEPSEITNLTSGQSVILRDTNGRPMWSGGGGWSG